MLIVFGLAVIFVLLFIRPQDDFKQAEDMYPLSQRIADDIIDTFLLTANPDDTKEMRLGQIFWYKIWRKKLLEKLESGTAEDRSLIDNALRVWENQTEYNLAIGQPFAADGNFDYYLRVSIDSDEEELKDSTKAEVEVPVIEQPKVLTMAAGAGRR